ncbi:hypothetical protein QOZ80_2BG0194940 [Eleusine coracana subsp. coracana]|nr:hypothetical protein QOZ80_2BG0194940 [Eleusine coracana subsp. coracana]
MEGLVEGLEGVAIDEVERAETRRDRRAAEEDGDREERSRSTWAEVVSEEKGEDQERIWGQAEHERKQQQHVPVSTQLHSQDEGGERNGQGCDGATGTGNFRLQQQATECGREQQDGEERSSGGWVAVEERKRHRRPHQHSEEWKGYKRPPSEQEYSEDTSHIHHGLNVEPTREELNNLSKACSRLWELDLNRLIPGTNYVLECGEGKKVYHKGDKASENLFCWLEDDVLRRPTYSRFCALLDNYNPHQGYKESVTQQDKYEEAAFIEEISRSAPIKYLHRYLVAALAALLHLSMCLWERSRVRGKVRMRSQASTTGFSFTLKNPMVMLITKVTYSQEGVGSCQTLRHSCSPFSLSGMAY